MGRKPAADGRADDDPEGFAKSAPAREAHIDRPFAAGIYDVTREEYDRFVRETGTPSARGCYIWNGDQWTEDTDKSWRNPGFKQSSRDPVVCVNWKDAEGYLHWLNAKVSEPQKAGPASDAPYRLLTWEEAEYAASAGTKTAYYWGDEASRTQANYGADQCAPCKGAKQGADRWLYTSPVASFPPNAFGLYDMAGNVWQWTADCWPLRTPRPIGECTSGAVRGGSWLDSPNYVRVSEYNVNTRLNRNNTTGFRVARTLGVADPRP